MAHVALVHGVHARALAGTQRCEERLQDHPAGAEVAGNIQPHLDAAGSQVLEGRRMGLGDLKSESTAAQVERSPQMPI